MAFVRWSSDEFRSDFYIYADVSGGYTLHLADARLKEGVSHADAPPMLLGKNRGFNQAWVDWSDENHEAIPHPMAGNTINTATVTEMIAECERLIAEGFHAPSWMIDRLKRERAECGDTNDPLPEA